MNCIILGDKYRKGTKSKGCAGLIKFDKSNIFDHQYITIKKYFPQCGIVYIGGFEAKKIEHFIHKNYTDITFINNTEYESYNETYSLSLAKDFLIDNALILSGYTIFAKKAMDKFNITKGSQIFISNQSSSGIGCTIENNTIRNISFDLPNPVDDIYYISSESIHILNKILSCNKYKNYFIFELMNYLIDNNISIKPFFCKRLNTKAKNYEHT